MWRCLLLTNYAYQIYRLHLCYIFILGSSLVLKGSMLADGTYFNTFPLPIVNEHHMGGFHSSKNHSCHLKGKWIHFLLDQKSVRMAQQYIDMVSLPACWQGYMLFTEEGVLVSLPTVATSSICIKVRIWALWHRESLNVPTFKAVYKIKFRNRCLWLWPFIPKLIIIGVLNLSPGRQRK